MPHPTPLGRLAGPFRVEDVGLFLWIAAIQDLVLPRAGGDPGALAPGAAGAWPAWLAGAGLAVALFTRGPADTSLEQASSRRCVVSLILWFGARAYLGGSASWKGAALLWLTVGFVVLAPLQALDRMPRTGLALRRALVFPAQLVGNSLFAGQVTPEFLRGTPGAGDPAAHLAQSVVLAAFLFLYAVIGPRVLAGEAWTPASWLQRFALYVVALLLGRPAWARLFA